MKIKFSGPVSGEGADNVEIETGLDLPKPAADDDEFADQGPNQLHVVVIQAKNLPIMDKNLFSRYFISFICNAVF